MRFLVLSTAFWLLMAAGAAVAAGGDLFVLRDRVNLRQAPDLASPVIGQLNAGRSLTELERSGDWVHVGLEGAGNSTGWVHDSLVGPVWPRKEIAGASEDDLQALIRRMSGQIDRLSQEVSGLRREIGELRSDVGHLEEKVNRLR